MEPRIQYAKTSDGVSIAYATMGEGIPFVYVTSIPYAHCQRAWEFPEFRRYYEAIGRNRKLIRYDFRGTGLSQHGITEYSMDSLVLDLEAVVERLGLDRFLLFGDLHGGSLAITYAARHPEHVSHLILWCVWARAADFWESPRVRAFGRSLDRDWETYTEAAAQGMSGWSAPEYAHRVAAYMRDCVTDETAKAAYRAVRRFDVTDLLARVSTPTLVLHPEGFQLMDIEIPTRLASELANAQLTLVRGESSSAPICDVEAIAEATDEFLGEGEEAEAKTELPEGMAVILFADIVESTSLTEQLGDAAFRDKARELDTSLRTIIRECSGTPVEGKVLGDGVLAVFTSARQAIECGLRCNAASEPIGLHLHLGIHVGDVIREGNNVYGGAVNIAARIAGESLPGEVLVSDTVRGLARTSAGVAFEDKGARSLKGIADPHRLFAVRGGGA